MIVTVYAHAMPVYNTLAQGIVYRQRSVLSSRYRVHVSRRGFTGLSGDEMVGRGAQIGAIRFLCDHAFVTI